MPTFIRIKQGQVQLHSFTDTENAVRETIKLLENGPNLCEVTLQKYIQEDYYLKGKTIVIDAGHGGIDSGAHDGIDSIYGDTINSYEKYLNLDMSRQISYALRHRGATVYETRVEDKYVSLKSRSDYANAIHKQSKVDLYLSVHFNASKDSNAKGIETFTLYNASKFTKGVAQGIQTLLIKATGAVDRKVKEAGFHVLRETIMPAVLVEYGFLTNNEEEIKCNDPSYRSKMVQATVDGIVAGLVV